MSIIHHGFSCSDNVYLCDGTKCYSVLDSKGFRISFYDDIVCSGENYRLEFSHYTGVS